MAGHQVLAGRAGPIAASPRIYADSLGVQQLPCSPHILEDPLSTRVHAGLGEDSAILLSPVWLPGGELHWQVPTREERERSAPTDVGHDVSARACRSRSRR